MGDRSGRRGSSRSGSRMMPEVEVALVVAEDGDESEQIIEALEGSDYRTVVLTDPPPPPSVLAAKRPQLVIIDAAMMTKRASIRKALNSLFEGETVSVLVIGGAAGKAPLLGDNAAEVHLARPLTLEDLSEAIATAEWARPTAKTDTPVSNPAAHESNPSTSAKTNPRSRKETDPSEANSTADYSSTAPDDGRKPKFASPARMSKRRAPQPPPVRPTGKEVTREKPRRKRFKSTLSLSTSRMTTMATAAHSPEASADADEVGASAAQPPLPHSSDTELVPRPDAETLAWSKASGTINKRAANVKRERKRSTTFLREHTQVADRYQVLGVLGSGGMATVYRVHDEELEEDVALKLLKTDKTDATSQHRFRQEMRICRRLQHPNIVRTYEFGIWKGRRFITMELLEGRDLAELLLIRNGALPLHQGIELLTQATEGLRSAHQSSVIHRDIKPHNLFVVRGTDLLKVMDFGIAKTENTTLTVTSSTMVLGTPAYMAPEQIKGDLELSAQTDIYSLGVVMYQIFTGALPFHTPDISSLLTSIVLEDPPLPRMVNPALPKAVEQVILRAMCKTPQDRYASCAQLLEDMQALRCEFSV